MSASARTKIPLTQEIQAAAQVVVRLTVAEAAHLPGFLGRIVPAMLAHPRRGWYGCTWDGTKTLFVLKAD